MPEFIYGLWPIIESLRANRRSFEKLIMTDTLEEKGLVAEIASLAREKGVDVSRVQKRIIDDVSDNSNHQGMALRVSPYPFVDIQDMLDLAEKRGEKPFILFLDLLKDP